MLTARKGGGMTADSSAGRVNQKRRTRAAILAAARDLITGSAEVTMPAVAQAALVSEATAYRYFPDLISLLREAVDDTWPSPAEALGAAGDSSVTSRPTRAPSAP
jgi:AcrR family transcriptional regulator